MSSRKKQSNRREKAATSRRERARSILKTLGLWGTVAGTNLEERMLAAHYPRVDFELVNGQVATDGTNSILRELRKAVTQTKFKCPRFEKPILVIDYFSEVKPLMDLLYAANAEAPPLAAKIERAKDANRELASPETGADALVALWKSCDDILIKYGRIDMCIYHMSTSHNFRAPNGNFTVKLLLHYSAPRRMIIQMPEGSRPAFHCGQPNGLQGIDWVEWDLHQLGLPDESRKFPVYVQSHVLDRLYKRDARAVFVKDGEWLVHECLWRSLKQPKVSAMPQERKKFLIEYNLVGHKIGYLVAERVGDKILIETFLFLTMNQTPEGEAINRRLRLSKDDKKYLELDKIQTFILTDIQFDPELVQILNECGCGHLFNIVKNLSSERYVSGYAQEFRKYLNLDFNPSKDW